MKIIKETLLRNHADLPARLIQRQSASKKVYEVQYFDTGSHEWVTPDYGPGSAGWTFINRNEAVAFWTDLVKLSPEQMTERYEKKGRWVA